MSYNNNTTQPRDGRYWTLDDQLFLEKLKSTAAWYNPATTWEKSEEGVLIRPETVHVGDNNGFPTWEEPVFDVRRYKQAKQAYRQGSLNKDQMEYSPWLSTEWEEAAKIRADELKYGKSYVNSPFRQASGTITSGDMPSINVIQVLGEIQGEDNRDYVLEQAVTQTATPNLVLQVDQWSGFSGSLDVAEGEEPLVKKGAFSRTEYMLKKQAAAIAITDEASVRYDRDVFAQHVRQANIAMRREKNQKIATELEQHTGATDIAAGDWLAWITDHRARDASRDIYAAAAVISANGGIPNTIVSHSRVFNDFVTNTAGPLAPSQGAQFQPGVVNNIPALRNFTWYIDDLKTATLATVYDRSAVLFMQGPTKTEQWRIPGKMITQYMTVDFNQIRVIDNSRIRDITGVSAA